MGNLIGELWNMQPKPKTRATGELDTATECIVREYVEHRSVAKAAKVLGMERTEVLRVLSRANVKKRVNDVLERVGEEALVVSAFDILDELASVAFSDNVVAKDKLKALDMLGKYRGIKLFTEVVETNATDESARQQLRSVEDRLALMEKSRKDVIRNTQTEQSDS